MRGPAGGVHDARRQPRHLRRFTRVGLLAARADLRQGGAGTHQLFGLEARMDSTVTEPLELTGRHIVLGLSGGIACYKAADLARELIKAGPTLPGGMTAAAQQFITPVTSTARSG